MVQIICWNVLLTQSGTDALDSVGQKFSTDSKIYRAMLCDAASLRSAVAQGLASGQVIGVSRDDHLAQIAPKGATAFNGYGYQLDFQFVSSAQQITFYGRSESSAYGIEQLGTRRARVHFDYPRASMWITDTIGEAQAHARLACDHEIVPGQSIALLGLCKTVAGPVYGHLIVWEAYAATPREMEAMSTPLDAGWWCRHGPQTLHEWAAQASEWSGSVGGRPLGAPSIERKLDDGESLWLLALTRPARWPFCWWDPSGNPAGASANAFPFDGDPPAKLMVQVVVSNAPHSIDHLDPQDWNSIMNCYPIADDAKIFTVGVPIGPWKKVADLKAGQSISADGINYSIQLQPNSIYQLIVTGVLKDDFRAIPIKADGTREDFDPSRKLKWEVEATPRTYIIQRPLDMTLQTASFLVQRRHRQFVTFSGFATQPSTRPPPCPTPEQAAQAVAAVRTRALQEYLKQFPQQRIGRAMQWFLPEPKEYFDANNLFLHAAVLGDEKTVRRLLTAVDPKLAAKLDVLAHVICHGQNLRRTLTQRFGESGAHQLLDQPGLFEDIIAELMSCGWSGIPDEMAADQQTSQMDYQAWDDRLEPLVWHHALDGLFHLNVDGLAEWPDISERLDRERAKVDRIEQMMSQQPAVSIAQLKSAIARAN